MITGRICEVKCNLGQYSRKPHEYVERATKLCSRNDGSDFNTTGGLLGKGNMKSALGDSKFEVAEKLRKQLFETFERIFGEDFDPADFSFKMVYASIDEDGMYYPTPDTYPGTEFELDQWIDHE